MFLWTRQFPALRVMPRAGVPVSPAAVSIVGLVPIHSLSSLSANGPRCANQGRCRISDGLESNSELGVREARFRDATATLDARGRYSLNVFGSGPSSRCRPISSKCYSSEKPENIESEPHFFSPGLNTLPPAPWHLRPFATAHLLSGEPTPPYMNKVLKTGK